MGNLMNGSMPEWLMGADCKSAGLPTLVQIQFGPISGKGHLCIFKRVEPSEFKKTNTIIPQNTCGCGGMVDTGDLKSPADNTA